MSAGVHGEPPAQPINQHCPVMPEEEVDPKFTLVYEGRTVGFCCNKCLARFAANPDRYMERLASVTSAGSEAGENRSGDFPGLNDEGHRHEEPASAVTRPPLLARYHPVIVHFPLAGVPLALAGLCVWLLSKRQVFAAADVPPILLAALAAIVAVVTGNVAHDSMSFSPALHRFVDWHQYTGTVLMALTIVLSGIRLWRWNRLSGFWLRVYAGGLVGACLLAVGVGFLGGSLVFGPDHLRP